MPRRSILSATERESLLALPDAKDELIRLYTFNDADLSRIRQHRVAANRLGFAVQLCYMRYPGIALTAVVHTKTACSRSPAKVGSFEQQRYRASGLNLVTAAIVLWNTV